MVPHLANKGQPNITVFEKQNIERMCNSENITQQKIETRFVRSIVPVINSNEIVLMRQRVMNSVFIFKFILSSHIMMKSDITTLITYLTHHSTRIVCSITHFITPHIHVYNYTH